LLDLPALEVTRATGAFYDSVIEGKFRVRTNADLDRAVSGAAKREVGDAWTWGRKSSKVEISLLVENGNSVPLSVNVESLMTAQDYVKRIGVFNEKNPLPDVAIFNLTPRCGRAQVASRMRLNDTQMITAVAEMSDGTYWSATSEVIVTLPACVEE
jgi:sulfur-oxidizing protein SoxY